MALLLTTGWSLELIWVDFRRLSQDDNPSTTHEEVAIKFRANHAFVLWHYVSTVGC